MALQIFNRKNINYKINTNDFNLEKFIQYVKEINSILTELISQLQINISISNEEIGFNGTINDLENEKQSLLNRELNFFSCNFYSTVNTLHSLPQSLSISIQKNVNNISLSSNNIDVSQFIKIEQITRKNFPEIIQVNPNNQKKVDLENLDSKLETIKTKWELIDFQKFYKSDLGVENIEALKPIVDDVHSKLGEVINFGSSSIPKPSLYNLYIVINNFFIQLERIAELNNEDFITQKSTLVQSLKNSYESILLNWAQVAAIISLNLQEENKTNIKQIDNIKKEIADTKEFINTIKSDYETSLSDFQTKFKNELENSQLIKEKNTFEQRAEKHRNNSYLWLGISVIIFGVLSYLLLLFFLNPLYELSKINLKFILQFNANGLLFSKNILWYQILKTVFFKLLIISVIIYALSFSIKNYNVEKHNFVINTNKVNSIQSALHFLNNNLIDVNAKNEIIKLVCQAIFSQHNTGFISKEAEPNNPIIIDKIIEKIPLS